MHLAPAFSTVKNWFSQFLNGDSGTDYFFYRYQVFGLINEARSAIIVTNYKVKSHLVKTDIIIIQVNWYNLFYTFIVHFQECWTMLFCWWKNYINENNEESIIIMGDFNAKNSI